MKMKKAIKKIAALSVGATMMGATLLGATAADLSMYPEPFVMDGTFNGLMVVGDDAAPADIIGVTDIAIALQFSSTTTKTVQTGGSSSVSIEGDAVSFDRSGDVLEMNEKLGDVVETMDASDAEGLKGFTVSNSKGTTDVNQYLRFNWGTGAEEDAEVWAKYDKDDDDNVGDFLFFDEGEWAFQYQLEFEEGFETDVEDYAAGTGDLEDLEDETLHVLGEDFAVTRATLKTSGTEVRLELMGGAVHDTLEEGETRTYTIDGKDYEVTVLIITDTGAERTKFKVNGQVTKQLNAGDTEILSDGTTLGIRELLPNEAGETAGGDLAEFYLGANKVVIEGGDDDGTYGTRADVDINEENMEDVYAYLDYTNTGNETIKIHKITWMLAADGVGGDEPFLMPGQGLAEWLDEPEGMWSSSWDIAYEGLTDPGYSMIEFNPRGDDEYKIAFENSQGIEYSIPLGYGTANNVALGDDDDLLVIYSDGNVTAAGNFGIDKNDYFVLSHNGGLDTGVTRVLRLESIDTSDDQVQFTDAGTGGQVTATYTAGGAITGCEENGAGELNIGGYTFDFHACYNSSATGDAKYLVKVDHNDSGALGGQANIVVNGGGIIEFQQTGAADPLVLFLLTDDDNFDESPTFAAAPHAKANYETLNISIDADSSGNLDVDVNANQTQTGLNMQSHEDNDDLSSGMTNYGVHVEEMDETNDPDSLDIKYPLEQVLPQAFVVFEGAVVKEGGAAGTVTYEVPNRIEIGAALLASQVSDATAANVLSVGGSCVNEVTAELLGLTYPACGEASGLAEGEGLIKLVENGDNVAIIVAGWDAADTTRATRVLSDWETWQDANKLVGTEVKVTGTSLTNYDVAPVTVEEPETEE